MKKLSICGCAIFLITMSGMSFAEDKMTPQECAKLQALSLYPHFNSLPEAFRDGVLKVLKEDCAM
ncbi:hypothetical protein ACVBEF_12650 [Glaciimonas sp. GG7]